MHGDLDDLLLVQDHTERVFEHRLQQRMRVGDRLAPLLAPDVWMNRVALDRPWPDDGHLHHQVVEGVGSSTWKRLHLRPRLDLEDSYRVRLATHREDSGVVQSQLIQVRLRATGVLDELERLRHYRQGAQAEHVHLDQPKVLDVVLVELHDAPAFHRRRLHWRDVDQRLSGDEHPSVVDGQVARELDHLSA